MITDAKSLQLHIKTNSPGSMHSLGLCNSCIMTAVLLSMCIQSPKTGCF